MYFDFAVQRIYKIQRKIRLIALSRKLLVNDDRFTNVVRRTLWAMAMIHEHIDVLPFSSTLFEIYWQNLDQRRTEANIYRHAPLRKWISERAHDDMCIHTCDFAIVCCATVAPQAWTGTWRQLHCDTHLAHVYEAALIFQYYGADSEDQNWNSEKLHSDGYRYPAKTYNVQHPISLKL